MSEASRPFDAAAFSRLRWRCTRRAMLEMDLLMGGFLEKEFSGLSPDEQAVFAELAECEDMTLWPWICGQEACLDARLLPVLAMLRRHIRSGAKEEREPA